MNKDCQIWRLDDDRQIKEIYISILHQKISSSRTCGRPRQHGHVVDPCKQGHVAQLENDKCQVDSALQVHGNHKSELHMAVARLMTHHRVTQELRHSGNFTINTPPKF
jgi:hypothetical protein